MTHLLKPNLVLVVMIVSAMTAAIVDCQYPDWPVAECEGASGTVNITCRQLAPVPGGNPIGQEFSCEFLWCDLAVICYGTTTDYVLKNRTKKFRENSNATNCTNLWMVTSVTDGFEPWDCCNCRMPDIPQIDPGDS